MGKVIIMYRGKIMKKRIIFSMLLLILLVNVSNISSVENISKSNLDLYSPFYIVSDNEKIISSEYILPTRVLNQNSDGFNYVIITTDELKDLIISSSFYSWKESLGFNINIITITDSLISDQPGDDLPAKIRNFLRMYYEPWGINYVLIVGSHDIIPMRYCYPDPNNHQFNIYDWSKGGEVPTDYYYADLSASDEESWDSDGDGYYGEFSQDQPDFNAEVYVGRIPTSDSDEVIYTLNKITLFEQDSSEWKNNALHAGSMLFYKYQDYQYDIDHDIDGATCLQAIEEDFMQDWNVDHLSEQDGISPSIYPWDSLTESAFTQQWRLNKYAVVNWAGHGSATGVGRTIWDNDNNGNGIPENAKYELRGEPQINIYSDLEDDYPSIVFAVSCLVGYPEQTGYGNLGMDLLIKESFGAAVAVCSATRPAAITVNFTQYHAGAEALCYEFNNYLINRSLPVGNALYDSKAFVHYNFGWNWFYEFKNIFNYNLYGDPSMHRAGISDDNPSISILSPDKGIYVLGKKILPFFSTVVVGKTLITTTTSEQVGKVDFYIDDTLVESDTIAPFEYMWDEKSFSRHTIRVVAFDNLDRIAQDESTMWKMF